MKKIAVPIFGFSVFAALAADQFIFSSDAVKAETKPRELPSAAIRLSDGSPVFGLHALTDAERGACGWYRILPPVKPEWATNHVFSCTNYTFNATGTANQIGKWTERKARAVKLDRDKVKAKLKEIGKGEILDNWAALPIELVQWYFCEMEYVKGGEIANAICREFGWTPEQLEQFADECRPDKKTE